MKGEGVARRVLIVQVAGLGYDFFVRNNGNDRWRGLCFRCAESVFPALTCTVQASFRTAQPPCKHGMVMNGVYMRHLRKPSFWEQSSRLVECARFWEPLRASGGSVGMLFWQQSLGEDVDVLLSPAPIHKHGGGMVDDVYSRPAGLYGRLVKAIGKRFRLSSYWGPLAGAASSRWIARATSAIMGMDVAPDLLLTYLPHLDYALQRHGPAGPKTQRAFAEITDLLVMLLEAAEKAGYEVVVFGDYAFAEARRPLYPNRLLWEKGLLATRRLGRRLYPDFHYSRAFAVADHEIAHVYVQRGEDIEETVAAFRAMKGIERVLAGDDLEDAGIGHPNCGEIVLAAEDGAWFAYPWWQKRREAPDYATHVDIHNKPGYDPAELFFGWLPFTVSTDARRVKGTHGRTGNGRKVAWAGTIGFDPVPTHLLGLAGSLKDYLEGKP